jgi:hypothetical protein
METSEQIVAAEEEEHPVKAKLRTSILPWLESAKLLHKQWFYRLHVIFGYATDITIGLGAVGISLPLAQALTQPSNNTGGTNVSVFTSLPQNSTWLYYITAGFVVVWVLLRVVFTREDGQKKAVLAISCSQTMKQIETALYRVLAQPNPMDVLNKIILEELGPTIDRNSQEKSWPWHGPAPNIDIVVEQQLKLFCDKFSSGWSAADSTGLRR